MSTKLLENFGDQTQPIMALYSQIVHRRADLLRSFGSAAAGPVVGMDPQCHLRGAVPQEMLDLLDVHERAPSPFRITVPFVTLLNLFCFYHS